MTTPSRLTTDRGLTPAKLTAQIAAIRRLNATLPETFRLLTGIELEISADGEVDFDAGLLQELDVVIAAAHTGLKEPRNKLTRRLCKAMEHPLVDILAHPTGRMLGRADAAVHRSWKQCWKRPWKLARTWK